MQKEFKQEEKILIFLRVEKIIKYLLIFSIIFAFWVHNEPPAIVQGDPLIALCVLGVLLLVFIVPFVTFSYSDVNFSQKWDRWMAHLFTCLFFVAIIILVYYIKMIAAAMFSESLFSSFKLVLYLLMSGLIVFDLRDAYSATRQIE